MNGYEIPAHRRPSFWLGILMVFFGILLWVYPELLSFLVGAFFFGIGGILIGRVLFPQRRWDNW